MPDTDTEASQMDDEEFELDDILGVRVDEVGQLCCLYISII